MVGLPGVMMYPRHLAFTTLEEATPPGLRPGGVITHNSPLTTIGTKDHQVVRRDDGGATSITEVALLLMGSPPVTRIHPLNMAASAPITLLNSMAATAPTIKTHRHSVVALPQTIGPRPHNSTAVSPLATKQATGGTARVGLGAQPLPHRVVL